MRIQISKFGNVLLSRPNGKEAFLAAKAHTFNPNEKEFLLDFVGVDVLTPSWADEFISGIKREFSNAVIKYENTSNESVSATLKII
ncbi:MAG: STAS-like domain-containing protein [Endomicrobium sp.]|jgi:hypothetical protein|nr:STAS-like domain-containing protein [Endomicrobium sp.]